MAYLFCSADKIKRKNYLMIRLIVKWKSFIPLYKIIDDFLLFQNTYKLPGNNRAMASKASLSFFFHFWLTGVLSKKSSSPLEIYATAWVFDNLDDPIHRFLIHGWVRNKIIKLNLDRYLSQFDLSLFHIK